jgi:hypothetical protein
MCSLHYQRWKRDHPTELRDVGYGRPAIDRLLSRCVLDGDCWVYTWPTCAKGYVRIRTESGKRFGHRIAWEHFIDDWPDDLTYDHLCRRTSCVNPWHGNPVPRALNSSDNANARKTHCPQGHPLSGDNLRYATRGTGRVCKACRAASNAAYRAKEKSA